LIISQIVAVSENGIIGKNNELLWHIAEDLNYFKKRTTGKILIMGRKTFDSLKKPLPKRFHIVISRSAGQSSNENVKFVSSISEAYQVAEKLTLSGQWPEEVMIIGGGEIYQETRKDADFLYITRIPGHFDGDTRYSLEIPNKFKIAFSQFSEINPGLRFEIWSKERTDND
jgi:dihydrofolate reductase